MATPFIGEIRLVGFNFAPSGWAFCDGAVMPIAENEALFSLIGTTYGGDGQSTFQLPDLQGRLAFHEGSGFVMGEVDGSETVTLLGTQIPQHSHGFQVGTSVGTTNVPSGNFVGIAPDSLGNIFAPGGTQATMANAVTNGGGSGAHDNLQPYLVMNYIISLFGIFPSPN